MAVRVNYPDGTSKSYSSPDAARADMANKGFKTYTDNVSGSGRGTSVSTGSGGTNKNNTSGSSGGGGGGGGQSVVVNGRVITDPKQVAKITSNREAAARYAIQDYQRNGTPIPGHLTDTVNSLIQSGNVPGVRALNAAPQTIGGYTGLRDMFDGGGPGQAGPQFAGGGALSNMANAVGLKPLPAGGSGTRLANGALFLGGDSAWNDYTKALEAADASVSAIRQGPTPGPNEFPGLGAPGSRSDREDNPNNKGFAQAATPPAASVDSGNAGNANSAAANENGAEVSRRNAERSQVPTYEAGGYVGKDGMPIRPSTGSLDLPPALARMLNMPMQSYAEGGMVGPGGMPQRPMTSPMAMNVAQQGGAPVVGMAPPGGQGRPLNFAAIDQQAQQFMQQNPQQVEMIRAEVQKSMAEGEIDEQGLNTFVQIATAALQNPEMWPQLRQVLIRQGMLDAEDVGEEYDQGFLIVLYIIGKTMGGGQMTTPAPQQAAPMSAGQPAEMSMAKGGALPAKSKNPDGSIPINAHEGEYVIPADVTRKLGTDHFDKLIAKTRGAQENGGQ